MLRRALSRIGIAHEEIILTKRDILRRAISRIGISHEEVYLTKISNKKPPFSLLISTMIYVSQISSVVERPLMVRWVVGSITLGGPIELFLVAASAPQLV